MSRAVRPYLFFATMALSLTACTTTPEPPPAPLVVAHPSPIPPPKKIARPAKPKPAETVAPKPVTILGKREEEVIALLGAPLGEEAAPPARILRFAAEGCRLEVYLFPDMAQGGFRALDMKASGGVSEPQCLERIRSELAD